MKIESEPFQKGCHIWHNEFGIGEVTKVYDDGICVVDFDKFGGSQKRMLPDKICKATFAHHTFHRYCHGSTNMTTFELLKSQKDVEVLKHKVDDHYNGEILDILKYQDGSYLGLVPSYWGPMMSVIDKPVLVNN